MNVTAFLYCSIRVLDNNITAVITEYDRVVDYMMPMLVCNELT